MGSRPRGLKSSRTFGWKPWLGFSFCFRTFDGLAWFEELSDSKTSVLDRKRWPIDCSSSNGSSNCGPSCSRWPPALISCGIYKRTWNLERLRNPLRLLRCDAANWYRLIVCLMNYSLIFSSKLMINCVCLACHEWDLTCSFVRRALLLRLCS